VARLRELAVELAVGLRERVLPALGSHAGRAHADGAGGGDVTFAIDADAEAWMEDFLAECAPHVAFYSEDRGLVMRDGAEHVLLVDPIDGTRPAHAAGRPLDDRPLLGAGPEFQMSMLAAANPDLHAGLVEAVDRGIARLRGLTEG
jgi:Inositol monophosphatase family